MRTPNLRKGRRAAGFFRLCLGIIASLTLAMGGLTLLNTQPVQAVFDIVGPFIFPVDNVTECQPFSIDHGFSFGGEACPNPPLGDYVFYWGDLATPLWAHVDPNTGVISGCVDNGTAPGPYPFNVWASQHYATPAVSGCLPPGQAVWPSINSYAVSLNVAPQAPCISINPAIYPSAWENVPYAIALSVTGGTGVYIWTAAGLPVGLNLDPGTGVVSGVPAPGTCGLWTVTVTCADNATCGGPGCCAAVTAPLYLPVDCWANYYGMVTTYTTTGCDFTVNIGPGLAYGTTNVVVDGALEATLAGNGAETFASVPCESHLVVVDQTVQGPDPKTRYSCVGSNQKWVSDVDSIAYFDYAPDIWIDTGSDPAGVAQPPGTGFYAHGAIFISNAPSPVQSISQPGTKYIFREWMLPDGSTNLNRDLSFAVSSAGKATALYDTYYELILKSDFPAVLEKSWEHAGSNATWKLALQPLPFPNFFGALGGVYEPTNAQGSHNMTGPYTQEIEWQENWFWPIFWIVVVPLAIAAAVFFLLRRKPGTAAPADGVGAPSQPLPGAASTAVKAATVETVEPKSLAKAAPQEPIKAVPPLSSAPNDKKALTESDPADKANFCPKCGNPVDKDAEFCKKCGKKL